jgi:hypothetical protein
VEPGQKLGNYVVQEKMGEGVTTSTYLLQERGKTRPAILKLLSETRAQDPAQVERFQREAKLVSHLRQANIVPVLECGQHEGIPYFITEYVEGKNLQALMGADGPVPFEIAILFLIDIARGLEYAHEHDVIHGRIRPDNLMLSQTGIVKIANSGLAWEMDDVAAILGIESFREKILYASPEQISGRKADARSDLFSLGVVSYELLAVCPFAGATCDDVAMAILEELPEPLENLVSPIPPDLAKMIRKMLEKDLTERCTAAEAREELEEIGRALGLHRGQEVLKEFLKDPVQGRRRTMENRGTAATPAPRGRRRQEAPPPEPDAPPVVEEKVEPAVAAPPEPVEEPPAVEAAAPPTAVEPPPEPSPEPASEEEPVVAAAVKRQAWRPSFRLPTLPFGRWFAWGRCIVPWLWQRPYYVGLAVFLAVGVLTGAVTSHVHHRTTPPTEASPAPLRAGFAPGQTEGEVPPESPAEAGASYHVQCRPVSAIVSVDGTRVDAGKISSFEIELSPGPHTFHVVHPGLRLDRVLRCQIAAEDPRRTLVLDLREGRVIATEDADPAPPADSH